MAVWDDLGFRVLVVLIYCIDQPVNLVLNVFEVSLGNFAMLPDPDQYPNQPLCPVNRCSWGVAPLPYCWFCPFPDCPPFPQFFLP